MERLAGCDDTVIDANEAVIIQSPTAGDMGNKNKQKLAAALANVSLGLRAQRRQITIIIS